MARLHQPIRVRIGQIVVWYDGERMIVALATQSEAQIHWRDRRRERRRLNPSS